MKIGIIGVGQIGGPLAHKLVKLGHSVLIANSRGPETLADLARESGANAVAVAEAVKADLIILSIPQKNVAHLPKGLFADVPASTLVLDTGNYYPTIRDGLIDPIEKGQTESAWVAELIGHPVIKVFNSIMAFSLVDGGLPKGAPGRIALPVAGDDAKAKATVIALLDSLGFDGVDAGGINESWRQEPGTPVYCTDFDAEGVRAALSKADRSRSPRVRDAAVQKMIALPKGTPPSVYVRMVREMSAL